MMQGPDCRRITKAAELRTSHIDAGVRASLQTSTDLTPSMTALERRIQAVPSALFASLSCHNLFTQRCTRRGPGRLAAARCRGTVPRRKHLQRHRNERLVAPRWDVAAARLGAEFSRFPLTACTQVVAIDKATGAPRASACQNGPRCEVCSQTPLRALTRARVHAHPTGKPLIARGVG